jgi:clan AA aspartic protease (TIGR02281 family)
MAAYSAAMARWILFAVLAGAAQAEVPLSVKGGYAFVQVLVAGQPFRMLLDTGASSCALTPEAARKAGLKYDHRVAVDTAAGSKVVPAGTARVSVGNVEAFDTEILAQSIDAVKTVDRNVDGVLGQSFLGRFPFLIDYKNKHLLIGVEADERAATVGAPIDTEEVAGRMVLPVALAEHGRTWRLALDSGSRRLLVECGYGCPRLAEHMGEAQIRTNAGDCSARQGYLRRIEIGKLAIGRVETLLIESAPQPGREEGLLPTAMFSAVYVNAGRNQVRLQR